MTGQKDVAGATPTEGYSLWGGRFSGGLDPDAEALNRSLPVDLRLWRQELRVAAAWVDALVERGALPPGEAEILHDGLERVDDRLAGGAGEGAPDEDIHTLVERLLAEEVGELAGKLRTGRSRNDQVATITRLWVMEAVDRLRGHVSALQSALLLQAQSSVDVLAPSYTHLQRAQPIRLAHFFLGHFWPLQRDRDRLARVREATAVLPLGAGAVAGSGFPVDRELLRQRLGFAALTPNSVDAVSDRDHVAGIVYTGSLLGVHLSRLAEDLILYSSSEFGFLGFADAYSTGSSIMPQKRNPDIAELARGQSARLIGQATAILTLMKGTPGGYNKDFQEDKRILFDVHDTLAALLPPLAGAVATLRVDPEACRGALDPSMLAVDVADELVLRGVGFKEAHTAVGALVREAEASSTTILDVPAERAATLHSQLPDALRDVAEGGALAAYERSVERRSVAGGTARSAVLEQIEAAARALES